MDRPEKATLVGLDKNGREIILEGNGFMARVLIHEIDHLDGRLFIDHLSNLKRSLIKGKLKKIKKGEKV